ncbi:DUF4232 domain-containing protein [Streptomyces sp. NPDC059096]|uniref:DUF4232 domain-containing protein n=1 Tax=Streptomyces sp. NPDC059096 TaxID=3346727 RepID=UPI003690602F
MRVRKRSVVAVTAVAACLSLSACEDGTGSAAGSAATGVAASSDVAESASRSAGGDGAAEEGPPKGGCRTSQLDFSSSPATAEGTLLVTLRNTGTAACSMNGFPGVDLKGKDGSVSAGRGDAEASPVRVGPGEEARFTLRFPPNDSGGSGVTFTSLVVTPPDETHSRTVPVTINVPAAGDSGPAISVDPVEAGK